MFKPNSELTQKALKKILRYEPRTGLFFWRAARSKVRVGQQAGSLTPEGYIRITVDGHRFMAHTLAWLYMTGEYVARGLDHRDTVRSNNRWANLRRADKSQNRMNSNVRSDNKSGRKGVCLRAGRKPYAQITIPGAGHRYLGAFDTIESAAARYEEECQKHFGEFARVA